MITLRFATSNDAAAIHAIYAPFVRESAITFECTVPSVETLAQRIETILQTHPWLVAETKGGELAGFVYASALRTKTAYQWAVETTIYLAEAHRGRGFGRLLYKALFEILAAQGHVWAYACLTSPHEASRAFHNKLGFEHVATFPRVGYKLERWWDVAWWRRGIRPQPHRPDPPLTLPHVRQEPAIQNALKLT
jgi:phosphinothricin acetyltransferase